MDDPHTRRKRSLGDGQVSVCVDDVSHDAIIHDFPYSNTLVADLLDAEDKVLHSQEYYSVGGGFIQWKGWEPPSLGEPVHRYSNMTELRAIVKEKGLNIYEIILDNEMAITGASRPSIIYSLNQIIDHMESSVRRGLDSEGQLPGPLKVQRKARMLWQQASRMQSSPDQFLTRINAYAFATAEENASGGVIVTAPTCGSAGVMPALVYALRHEMFIGDRAIREAFLASAAVGFIAKHNASIAGAEVGCQGEIGVASAMAAAFVADARGYRVQGDRKRGGGRAGASPRHHLRSCAGICADSLHRAKRHGRDQGVQRGGDHLGHGSLFAAGFPRRRHCRNG